MLSLEAGSATHPWLFAVLLIILGLLVGAGTCLLFMWSLDWVRRHQRPPMVAAWRIFFMLFVFIPLSVLPPQAAGVDPGAFADINVRLTYFLAFVGGFAALMVLSMVRPRLPAPRRPREQPANLTGPPKTDSPTLEDVRKSQLALRWMKILGFGLLIASTANLFVLAYPSENPVASTALLLAVVVVGTAIWQFSRRR